MLNQAIANYLFSEPFLEALPQLHILLVIWVYATSTGGRDLRNALIGNEPSWFSSCKKDCEFENLYFFWITFGLSVLSSSWGMSKYLMTGTCRLLPRGKYFGGLLAAFPCTIGIILMKGTLLYAVDALKDSAMDVTFTLIGYWFLFTVTPHMLFVSKVYYHDIIVI